MMLTVNLLDWGRSTYAVGRGERLRRSTGETGHCDDNRTEFSQELHVDNKTSGLALSFKSNTSAQRPRPVFWTVRDRSSGVRMRWRRPVHLQSQLNRPLLAIP